MPEIKELVLSAANEQDRARAEQCWGEMLEIYLSSFPEDERRAVDSLRSLAGSDGRFHIYVVENEEERTVAFITVWNFGQFVYGEHLAVSESMRGARIGSTLIDNVCQRWQKPMILEIEPVAEPGISAGERKVREARLRFYQRLGFAPCALEYIQPPYSPTQNSIPLTLMERGGNLLPDNFACVRDTIHSEVYGKK